ncbi:hypothetical protein Bxe_A3036 [Paraburkholderia xenovorans LB400]|jgi:hypothetical protein|uniref:Uncharacterized protein n=1 Tax=Paraburkholderia xenovorans (strain LB400) TaxID=266265 RepID=Q141P6_PARXL|nr:hypothetical protein Bxe_A3036 [Paraburkholderia xenovorans LB400]
MTLTGGKVMPPLRSKIRAWSRILGCFSKAPRSRGATGAENQLSQNLCTHYRLCIVVLEAGRSFFPPANSHLGRQHSPNFRSEFARYRPAWRPKRIPESKNPVSI